MDARISLELPRHPKTKKLIRRIGEGGAFRLVCLFLWVAGNRSSGDLEGLTDEDIELAVDWTGEPGAFVAALADVGFLDGAEGTRSVHDWAEHNPWAAGAEGRSERARAAAAKKWGSDLASANRAKRSERLSEARRKGTHTKEEWTALVNVCGNKCLRCSAPSPEIVKDHILAIVHGGSDSIENLQPLCRSCNAAKTDAIDSRPAGWALMLAERLRNACGTPAEIEKTPAPSPSPFPFPFPLPTSKDQSPIGDLSSAPAAPLPPPKPKPERPKAGKPLSVADLVSEGADPQHAADWMAVRARKKAPLTATAWEAVKREAKAAGISSAEAVKVCAERGWQGFNASWNWRGDQTPPQASPPSQPPRAVRELSL